MMVSLLLGCTWTIDLTCPDIEGAETGLANGTSPFHKVSPLKLYPRDQHLITTAIAGSRHGSFSESDFGI